MCSCCCGGQELSTVKETITYSWLAPNRFTPRYYWRYLDIPYCSKCLLHVKLGGLAPFLALFIAILSFPAVDALFFGTTTKGLLKNPQASLTLGAYCILSTALFLVGLLYIWISRWDHPRVPASYHWAGAIVGSLFFGLFYLPLGLTIAVAFGLGRLMPGVLGLNKASEDCAYWSDGKAMTCMSSIECANRRYAEELRLWLSIQ